MYPAITILFLMAILPAWGQENLVPNPSFEMEVEFEEIVEE